MFNAFSLKFTFTVSRKDFHRICLLFSKFPYPIPKIKISACFRLSSGLSQYQGNIFLAVPCFPNLSCVVAPAILSRCCSQMGIFVQLLFGNSFASLSLAKEASKVATCQSQCFVIPWLSLNSIFSSERGWLASCILFLALTGQKIMFSLVSFVLLFCIAMENKNIFKKLPALVQFFDFL